MFETLYADPARLKEFLAAMTGISHGAAHGHRREISLVATTKPSCDVGTAQGDTAVADRSRQPHLTGTRLRPARSRADLRGVRRAAWASPGACVSPRQLLRRSAPHSRRHRDGAHPARLGPRNQTHADRAKPTKPCPRAAPISSTKPSSTTTARKNAFGLMMSLNMLIETPGGFDYTGADCQGWMRDAGFRETRVEHLVGPGLDGHRHQVAGQRSRRAARSPGQSPGSLNTTAGFAHAGASANFPLPRQPRIAIVAAGVISAYPCSPGWMPSSVRAG